MSRASKGENPVGFGWIYLDFGGFIGFQEIYDLRAVLRGGGDRVAEGLSGMVWRLDLVGLGRIHWVFGNLAGKRAEVIHDMRCMISSFGCQNVMPQWTGVVHAALPSAREWRLSNGKVGND